MREPIEDLVSGSYAEGGWALSERKSRPLKISTVWCGRRSKVNDRSEPFMITGLACCARTAWAGTRQGNSECFAISTAEKATAGWNQWGRQPTGCVALEKLSKVELLDG